MTHYHVPELDLVSPINELEVTGSKASVLSKWISDFSKQDPAKIQKSLEIILPAIRYSGPSKVLNLLQREFRFPLYIDELLLTLTNKNVRPYTLGPRIRWVIDAMFKSTDSTNQIATTSAFHYANETATPEKRIDHLVEELRIYPQVYDLLVSLPEEDRTILKIQKSIRGLNTPKSFTAGLLIGRFLGGSLRDYTNQFLIEPDQNNPRTLLSSVIEIILDKLNPTRIKSTTLITQVSRAHAVKIVGPEPLFLEEGKFPMGVQAWIDLTFIETVNNIPGAPNTESLPTDIHKMIIYALYQSNLVLFRKTMTQVYKKYPVSGTIKSPFRMFYSGYTFRAWTGGKKGVAYRVQQALREKYEAQYGDCSQYVPKTITYDTIGRK